MRGTVERVPGAISLTFEAVYSGTGGTPPPFAAPATRPLINEFPNE